MHRTVAELGRSMDIIEEAEWAEFYAMRAEDRERERKKAKAEADRNAARFRR